MTDDPQTTAPASPCAAESRPSGRITRRQGLTAALAAPAMLGGPAILAAGGARAQTQAGPDMTKLPFAPFYRFPLGAFRVTSLLAGSATSAEPHKTFGLNASDADFAAASDAAFIPDGAAMSYYTPTLIETGSATILFDTGLKPEGILAALAAAGIAPGAITHVVITHMHGDHIGGLSDGTTLTFPDAVPVLGRIEFDHWAATGNEGFEAKVRPLESRATFLNDGDVVVPGITAELAAGHTPGHMIFHVESEGARLVLTADTANHYVWSLGYPDWEVRFDADKAAGIATRNRVLSMLAAERLPFIGYHMPFPALGFVEAQDGAASGARFRFVPASYQMLLGTSA